MKDCGKSERKLHGDVGPNPRWLLARAIGIWMHSVLLKL